MITQKEYKLIKKYASKMALRQQDADDITQEACLLLLQNPPTINGFVKRFYYVITKRGASRFYYVQKNDKRVLRDQETPQGDYLLFDNIESSQDVFLEARVLEFKRKASILKFKGQKEQEVFNALLTGQNLDLNIHLVEAHKSNILKKLRKIFKA